ncbi:MAG: arsenite methyltransferase [Bacteroidales bacterium]|nr:arsenite methyltransferase [Bacteroidales bacterium]
MSEEIKNEVKMKYSSVVLDNQGCGCGCGCGPEELSSFALDYSKLEGYNKDADYALGCGIPTSFADINKGDTVLDLGSGAGNDVFVARHLVGETGMVIGVDMTAAMIEKANQNKTKLGYQNIEFRLGEIEKLPVENDSINVAISNCVINLVPDKKMAYSEIYRVLKPGGKFVISDIVTSGKLPESLRKSIELYVGCVAGALTKDEYLGIAQSAVFKEVSILEEKEYILPDSYILQYLSKDQFKDFKESGAKILSLTVKGVK